MRTLLITLIVFLLSFGMAIAKEREPVTSKFQYGFIENKGQVMDQNNQPNNNVQYLLCAPGLNVQLRRGGFSYDTYIAEVTGQKEVPFGKPIPEMSYTFQRIDVELEGANKNCKMIAEQPATDYINYYTNGLRLPNVHHYSRVTYKDIYNGIDLEFTINPASGKAVEYNFIVAPGANPAQIKLRYEGAESTRLVDNKILLKLENDEIAETIPASYTALSRVPVSVKYKQLGSNTFSFSVPAYNNKETLIIDPTPIRTWSTYYGGTNGDASRDIVVSGNNIYMVGSTASKTQIATTGAYKTTLPDVWDAMLAQFTVNGTLNWATYYGGTGFDDGYGVAANANGDVYLVGSTRSPTGMATVGAHQAVHGGGAVYDGFLAKFNSTGALQWGTYYGGSLNDEIYDVTTGTSGLVYICGYSNSSNNIATTPAVQPAHSGMRDAFIAQFNSAGIRQWATYAGEANDDFGTSLATDPSGNIFMGGVSYVGPGTGNLTTVGVHQSSYGGGSSDCFVEKYDATGARLWGTYYGGPASENNHCRIATDIFGAVYITGATLSASGIATQGTAQTAISSTCDGFVAKLTPTGFREWGTYYGAAGGNTFLQGVAVQGTDLYAVGYTLAPGLATSNTYQTTKSTNEDGCMVRLDAGSGTMVWSTYYGDINQDQIVSVCLDAGHLYVAGHAYLSTGFSTPGAHQTTAGGGQDIYLTRFDCLNLFSATATATNACYGEANGTITVIPSGGIIPYSFKASSGNFQLSNILTGIPAGSHTVTIMDGAGCSSTVTQTVGQYAQVVLPPVTGKTTVLKLETATYSIATQSGLTYSWLVYGGSIVSGQNTNQVTIQWGQPGIGKLEAIATSQGPCLDTATMTIYIDPPLSVNDAAANIFSIYPNPTNGSFILKGNVMQHEKLTVQVLNILGRVLYADDVVITNNTIQKQYNLSHLANGIYTLAIKSASQQRNIRLIIAK